MFDWEDADAICTFKLGFKDDDAGYEKRDKCFANLDKNEAVEYVANVKAVGGADECE